MRPRSSPGRSATPVQITHDNDAAPALVTARSIDWKNDGFDVQGWLLAPAGADPARKAPMVTIVHGGPAAANVPDYRRSAARWRDLLAAGYYVFLPNPRGSYGQGEAFTAANKRDFGGGDLRDILAGIDAAEKAAPIDDARLGLIGGSYGGFMAMWANTQTNRFKAIVAGAGLSNWISYYGTNGIDQWMLPFFGKTMYDDPKAYEDVSAIYSSSSAQDADLHLCRRARHRGAADPVDRILARAEGSGRADQPGDLSRRGPWRPRAGACRGCARADGGVV